MGTGERRLFVGTLLPPDASAACDRAARECAARLGGAARPVPPHSAHITHAFLGNVPEDGIDAIAAIVREAVRHAAPMDLTLGAPELLGGRGVPRLVLMPVQAGRVPLHDLQISLVLGLRTIPSLRALPLPRSPHVTLARFNRRVTRHDGQLAARTLERWVGEPIRLRLDRLQLVQSTLTPAGPQYEPLADAGLGR